MSTKLDIGCGNNPKEGFHGVDCRTLPNVQFPCDAWKINEYFEPYSVDEIYSRHMLEHLTFNMAKKTLKVWYSILKSGGLLEIIVPNMEYHIWQYLKENRHNNSEWNINTKNLVHAIGGFWGWQNHEHDVHQSGYDYEYLSDMLTTIGYRNLSEDTSVKWNLHIFANKR